MGPFHSVVRRVLQTQHCEEVMSPTAIFFIGVFTVASCILFVYGRQA